MVFSFLCPSCGATISGSDLLRGRRIRCPECETMVEARQPATGTVLLTTPDDEAGKTVLLKAVDVIEEVGTDEPAEAIEAVEVTQPIEVTEPVPAPADHGPVEPPPLEQPRLTEQYDAPSQPRRKRDTEETEMDMTPMVDVTFLLLIFFMVTAAFSVQKSLEMPKPSDEDPSANVVEPDPDDQSDFVTVHVDEFNTFHVITVDWEEEAPSEQDLHIMLNRARDGDSTGTRPTKLRVEADGDSFHEKVVAALDAGTATGFEEVQLATIEDE